MDWKQEDLHGMQNPSPETWPAYPLLPMKNSKLKKRPGGFPEFGVLLAWDKKPIIYMAPLYKLGVDQWTTPTRSDLFPKAFEIHSHMDETKMPELRQKLEGIEKIEYPTFEALQEAGWEVD